MSITLTNSKEDANGNNPAQCSNTGMKDQENVKTTTLVTKLLILTNNST